jgi:replicative DNA helicase
MSEKARYAIASDVLDGWRDEVLTGRAPIRYPVGTGTLGQVEIGPGLVTLIGGAPGAGKTAFTMQCAVDALRITSSLRVLVCNIEMPPVGLLDRQLARLSGIGLDVIRKRQLEAEHADRIDQGLNTLAAVADRLCFIRPPFDLGNVAAGADDFGASLLLLDYIQRIRSPGEHADKRGAVDATMNYLRQFADAGVAVVVVSAVGRSRDKSGRSSYDAKQLGLASFRESSELEFGCDDAYILHSERGLEGATHNLKHLKSRNGECRDIALRFDGARQRFTSVDSEASEAEQTPSLLRETLAGLWAKTPAVAHDGETE